MAQKIPATIITGFLGAGKTTLIRHLLQNAANRRIALIINEFGDVGVDGAVLAGCADDTCPADEIMELSNGCICCTVADDFIPAMDQILARDPAPDHIIIETSGLALPQPLIRAFNWPSVKDRVIVDAVIALCDASAMGAGQFDTPEVKSTEKNGEETEHETPLADLFEDQLASADMIVLNKADLLDKPALETISNDLKTRTRAGVQILSAVKGVLPIDILLGQGKSAESDLTHRGEIHHHHHDDHDHHHHDDHHHDHDHHHHDHGHDAFETFALEFDEIEDKDALIARLSEAIIAHNILRLKGFVAIKDKPMRLSIQAVGARIDTYFDRPFATGESRQTHLVIIGTAGLDRASITKTLCP